MPKSTFVVLLLSYVAFVSIGLPDTVLGVAWPSLQASFGIPPSAMGAVLATAMGGYFLSGLFAGGAVARLGVGNLLTLSSALVVMALCGYALAPTWAAFFPFGAVWGLGSGAIDTALNAYAARHFSVRHVNWLHGCWGIGASIGPAVMTFSLARGNEYQAGYAGLAAVLGGLAIVFALTRRRWDDAQDAVGAASADSGDQGLRTALRHGRVWLQLLIFFFYTGVEAGVGQWCFSWLRERRGLSLEAAGSWTSAYWASLTVGRLVLGAVVGRVGPDRLVRAATVGAVIGVLLFAAAGGLLGCVGLLVLGASLAPIFPTLMARTPARVGDGLAHHAVGLQVSAGTLGVAVVPSVMGFLVARLGIGAVGTVVVAVAVGLLLAHEVLLAFPGPGSRSGRGAQPAG
jgi:fucose permease